MNVWEKHKGKRLHEGGVGPDMRFPVGQEPIQQKETPLAGRRAGDTVSGGVSGLNGSTFSLNVNWLCRELKGIR